MSGFKVEADFFFNTEVPSEQLLETLRKNFTNSTERNVASLAFTMSTSDILDVSFIVPTARTYAETMEVSRKFLDQLTEKVTELLSRLDAETSIEDDSLLLMPA